MERDSFDDENFRVARCRVLVNRKRVAKKGHKKRTTIAYEGTSPVLRQGHLHDVLHPAYSEQAESDPET